MKIRLVVFEIQTFKISIIWGKEGFPPKFKPVGLSLKLNYWVNFDKIDVIWKEIAHRCHFCNKILLLSMFKENDFLTFVGHERNYFLNMEIKIEIYFYNLKKLGRGNICGLVTICNQS